MTVIGNHLAFSYRVSFISEKKMCRLVSIHVAFGTVVRVCALYLKNSPESDPNTLNTCEEKIQCIKYNI